MAKPTIGDALRRAAGNDDKPEKQPETAKKAACRSGRVVVSAYMPHEVKSSIRLIQAQRPDKTLQDLMEEALNDLFAKYNVPQTARIVP